MRITIHILFLLSAVSLISLPQLSLAQTTSPDISGSRLYKSVNQQLAAQLVRDYGGSVIMIETLEDGFELQAQDSEGFKFELHGRVCSNGECDALVFSVLYEVDGMVDYARLNTTNLHWGAAQIAIDRDDFLVNRYEILDFGQTYDNLLLSLDVTIVVAKAAAKYYFSAWDDYDVDDWW